MTNNTPDRPELDPVHDSTSSAAQPSTGSAPAEQASGAAPGEFDGPPRGRGRWVAAAAAALGVALFAVPLLRGPSTLPSANAAPGDGAAPGAGPTCAVKEGGANFNFTLKDMNGADVRLADYKGKVVLLNFWATWCGPCKVEIPEFVEAYNKYRDRGFVILGVLSEDEPSAQDLKAFTGQYQMNYPILRAHPELEAAFGSLWALPTSFIIDRQGSICTKHMGPVSKQMLEREIKRLL